ncbi:SubName: Full=Uncharacterized protein {ECO:0000313/EMBL:CCA72977.1} [Serendipita indica DSM 11827]|uniref:Phosphoglycerate mutase n=1 Tax=Serendipita indica (strain DSM 11827) TaxID=1109443 RepID=G4TNT4_SERID|nr:SubName: Full=Uncharacterized protein {ECO:0000313/EMBL:CCA72977.1} [Serendipita indica DSM 11827]CCA72977.1 hypothetical protein PIIN_06932 [Serendipita indica DSM 11827]
MLVTFIRHGESTDNLRPVWAGWLDAPLSNHGMNQARALGEHWATTPITAVYCSDLKRAHTTAQQLVAPRNAATASELAPGVVPITLVVNPLLREQNFGVAENKPWAAHKPTSAHETEEEVYYSIYTRHEKFPEGESLDDLAERAEKALDETVWPHVQQILDDKGPGLGKDNHIVIVSHGLAISELVAALLRRSPIPPPIGVSYRGLQNTAWTQLEITIEHRPPPNEAEKEVSSIHLVSANNHPHLARVKRQAGGIGSAAHDEKQTSIRDFFGGATTTSQSSSSL